MVTWRFGSESDREIRSARARPTVKTALFAMHACNVWSVSAERRIALQLPNNSDSWYDSRRHGTNQESRHVVRGGIAWPDSDFGLRRLALGARLECGTCAKRDLDQLRPQRGRYHRQ